MEAKRLNKITIQNLKLDKNSIIDSLSDETHETQCRFYPCIITLLR